MPIRLLIPALFLCFTLQAQNDLSGSQQRSPYVYAWRLLDKEAQYLYDHNLKGWEKNLHSLADSFPSGQTVDPPLPPGNYLFLQAKGSYLSVSLRTMGTLRYKLLNNGRDVALLLYTVAGSPVSHAGVYIGQRKISYDSATGCYWLGHWRRNRQVKVVHQGALYYFPVTRNSPSYRSRSRWRRRGRTRYEGLFHSFFAFSKPKYKPGDTVQGKIFVMDRKGHPIDHSLILRLSNRSSRTDTILMVLRPYRPGGYTFSFVLSDSLHLRLDEEYTVTLEENTGRSRIRADEDDELADRRKVVSRGFFRYEEYELSVIKVRARVDRKEHGPGEPVSVFLQANDENDLPIADGRIEMQVIAGQDARGFQTGGSFIKDTLWSWTQPLDPVGETRIILPDSIFPPASFSYTIRCAVLNSNNELHSQVFQQYYVGDTGRIFFHPHNDSLDIDYQVRGHSRVLPAVIYSLAPDEGTRETQTVTLPVRFPINPYTSRYVVRVKGDPDSVTNSYRISNRPPFSIAFNRTRDSVHLSVNNSGRLHFWYTLTIDGHILLEGFSDSLNYQARMGSQAPCLLRIQYLWAGEVFREDYSAPFLEKSLRVEIKEPAFVYPGQRTSIGITVKDADGRPVPDADLTAWSWTSKFTDAREPGIPYLGRSYRFKPRYDYTINKQTDPLQVATPLVWQRWGRQLGLDTIEYYKFLNPGTVYINREAVANKETQLAPFVSRKGQLEPVDLLYIDERLVYFSRAQQLLRYSFRLDPGKHSLRIRIRDKEIRLDSLQAEKGMKTFLCINDDSANKAVRYLKMPDTLTRQEKELLHHSLLSVENTFGNNFTEISQGSDRRYLLNSPGSGPLLVGPFSGLNARLRVEDGFEQDFEPEGGYLFRIQPGLVREKEWPYPYPFHSMSNESREYDLHDLQLTRSAIDSMWQDYLDQRSANQDLYRNENVGAYGNGRLAIGEVTDSGRKARFIKKIFLFRYNDPDGMRIYKGIERNLGYVEPGYYKLLLLLTKGRYVLRDSISIQANGLNYYGFDGLPIQAADTFSLRIDKMLRLMEREPYSVYPNDQVAGTLQLAFNQHYADLLDLRHQVTGTVTDDKGNPLTGVTVLLKGTRRGTSTDAKGLFRLAVPERGTLVFAYIGFTTQERKVKPEEFYVVKLAQARGILDEVVVVGYGTQKKRELTGSIGYALAGRVAGLQIRGITSNGINQPLIIVDGLPFAGELEQLDAAVIGSVNVLKGAEATNIYGARAAAGVIVITTKKPGQPDIPSINAPMTGASLRRNFRDDAFWQPRLRTDANGFASFSVQYPDDITSWKTFAAAFTPHRQSGLAEGRVRSFKPLSAGLSLPAFLVAGDEARVIGKVQNYSPDSVTVERNFSINGKVVASGRFSLRNARIDTFLVHPVTTDSLHLLYTLKKDDYLDGEERSIPVFPAGVKETRGSFASLEGDTSIQLRFDTTLGPVSVYASASLLPVLLDEIESIRSYEYLCNEQLASKLIALLEKKKIYRLLQKEFREEDNIKGLITRLLQARKGSPLWGWWPEGAPSDWISLHVADALLSAEKEGYTVRLDKQALTDYLVYSMEKDGSGDGLFRLQLLQALKTRVDYRKYIDSIDKNLKAKSLYQILQLQQLRQDAGVETRLDTLVNKCRYTALGNCYWGEDAPALFDNAIQNTVLMYRLLRKAGGYEQLLKKTRDYLLEKRGQGHWRNTYESCLILETLLPDLSEEGQKQRVPALSINGKTIPSFPFEARFPAGQPMNVSQSGQLPVYFTAYQQFLNGAPGKVSQTFTVDSWFERNGQRLDKLRAGEPVTLQVEVEAKGDADYVLTEIPIPAGCIYQRKDQSYDSQEMHREYFKNKLSLFSQYLGKGKHRFTVFLLPRYTGVYHLNPARVEMMYFSVLYGREGIKTVEIE